MSAEFHKHTFAAGESGVKKFRVSPGRQVQVCVKDKGSGGVWDIVTYLATTDDNATPEEWRPEKNLSGEYNETSTGGFVEIGVDVTTVSDGDIVMEIREFKLG